MKAYLIKPTEKSIEPVDIDSLEDIRKLIGFDTVIADDLDDEGNQLFFDEECFLKGTAGRFKVDNMIPVSGTGIIATSEGESLTDTSLTLEALKSRVTFIQ